MSRKHPVANEFKVGKQKRLEPLTAQNCDSFTPAEGLTAEGILAEMTDEEKMQYLGGVKTFCIRAIPRLGVPEVWMTDATGGIRNWNTPTTILPANVAMAATFDRQLARQAGALVARECRHVGVSFLLAPGVNIDRLPVCGRNFEYMGEDPFLAANLSTEYIQGVQSEGVIATVKHFACNNTDRNRHWTDSIVDERTLQEIYLPAFRSAVKGGVQAVMTSYNLVNGVHASQNEHLVNDILRNKWGFDGVVMSDWVSVYDTEAPLKHGIDLEMPDGKNYNVRAMRKLLDEGRITMADIDSHVLTILKTLEKAGVLSRPVAEPDKPCGNPEHAQTALRVAKEGIVLLRNDASLLPLQVKKTKKVVILGANADIYAAGGGSSCVIPLTAPKKLSEAIRDIDPAARVSVFRNGWYKDAFKRLAVAHADLVVYEAGYNKMVESESFDRQYELTCEDSFGINCAKQLNNDRLCVVMHSGADFETKSWINGTKTIIDAFYLGPQGADALASVLFGNTNPSGKMPHTVAVELDDYLTAHDLPENYTYHLKNGENGQGDPNYKGHIDRIAYDEGLLVGYRQFDTLGQKVEFPFGHGLSYTKFDYSNLKVERLPDCVRAIFDIRNSGSTDGTEVAQLYIHDTDTAKVRKPFQELKGFERIDIKTGDTRTVVIDVPYTEFSHFDTEVGDWVIDPHLYNIRIGSSSRDIRLECGVQIDRI